MPTMEEVDTNIVVRPEDIRVEVYRASGAGGQKVNKTSSAVRIIHLATGIVVSCQVERSQYQNKDVAMRMLKSKLLAIKIQQHLDKIEDIKGRPEGDRLGQPDPLLRLYALHDGQGPPDELRDGNVDAVMDGDLDGFINAYLKALAHGEIKD